MTERGADGRTGTFVVKSGLAQMLKGGVIMDVTTADQARVAEEAGACAVMALERIPADIRAVGGVARMSVPVMAKCRIGHFVEAQILQALEVDFIDESEVLTPADEAHHVDKNAFTVPFVCGATDLGEALRRVAEGAAMIRTKGEAGTGNVVEAVRHMRAIQGGIRQLAATPPEERYAAAKELRAPYELVQRVALEGRLPVVNFSAGGIATPADAALVMQLGAEGVFVGSGIFKSADPPARARAIVEAVTHFRDPEVLARVSGGGAVGPSGGGRLFRDGRPGDLRIPVHAAGQRFARKDGAARGVEQHVEGDIDVVAGHTFAAPARAFVPVAGGPAGSDDAAGRDALAEEEDAVPFADALAPRAAPVAVKDA